MSSERNMQLMHVAIAGAGIASLYIVGKSLLSSFNRLRTVKAALAIENRIKRAMNDPLASSVVVNSAAQWDTFYESFSRDLADLPIIGFDCEWITLDGYVQPVALVQLASYRGDCALVRLNKISTLPTTLQNLLSNRTVLKVGVCTSEDATKLHKDFGIQTHGFYDLRHLLHHHPNFETVNAPAGLSGLCKHFLEVDLNKHRDIRCSNWEAECLNDEQIKYAAQDALASLCLCLKLVNDIMLASRSWTFQYPTTTAMYSYWFKKTSSLIDTKYKLRNKVPKTPTGTSLTPKRQATGITNVSKVEKMSRGHAARKTPLYDNCILQAPDGQQLCTCDTKKAMWYVNKQMGEIVCPSPFTVRLNFEPSGRPSSEYDYYYIVEKANICVVCGCDESFLRKNIVPHEYRKHFPAFLKDHKSHDILLLCLTCHARYNTHEASLKLEFATMCDAPIGTEQDVKFKLDRVATEVQCAANALVKNRCKMPQTRIEELEQKVKNYFQVDSIDEGVLKKAQNLETQVPNSEYVPHGLKVVQFFKREENGLVNFEKRWREHFVEAMKPRYLPELWCTSHSRKITDKWGSGKSSH